MANNKVYCKTMSGTVKDLTQDTVYTHPQEKQCAWEPDSAGSIVLSRIVSESDISAGTIVDYDSTTCYRNDKSLSGDDYVTLTASQIPGNYGSTLYDATTFGDIVIAIIDNKLHTFKYTEDTSNYKTGGSLSHIATANVESALSGQFPRIHPFGDDYIINNNTRSLWYVECPNRVYQVAIDSDGTIKIGTGISRNISHTFCALNLTHIVDCYLYDYEIWVAPYEVFDESGNPVAAVRKSDTSIANYGNLRYGIFGTAAYCRNNRILIWWFYGPSSNRDQTVIEYIEFDSDYQPTSLVDYYSLGTDQAITYAELDPSFGADSVILGNTVRIYATTNSNYRRWLCLSVNLNGASISSALLEYSSTTVKCAAITQDEIHLTNGTTVTVYNKSGSQLKSYTISQGELSSTNLLYFPLERSINNNGYLLVTTNSSGQPYNTLQNITYGATDDSNIHYWSSVINQSTMGIALNDAVSGELCNIAVDGIVSANWATAEQTISNPEISPSVSAICPENGYLNVRAKYHQ